MGAQLHGDLRVDPPAAPRLAVARGELGPASIARRLQLAAMQAPRAPEEIPPTASLHTVRFGLVNSLPRRTRKLTIGSFDEALLAGAERCDLRDLRFIDAYGLVGTACALRLALAEHRDLVVEMPAEKEMRRHLAAMGFGDFLAQVGKPGLLPDASVPDSDVVAPLRSAADTGGEEALSHLLWGQLRDRVDPQVLAAITEGVWEIVANALEHSGSDASVMAQVYSAQRGRRPDHKNRVQLVIGDVGRGIRASFLESGAREPQTDLEAIDLALRYLVSSIVDDPGRGQGLSTTMEQVVGLGGQMVIRSGTGKISIDAGGREEDTVAALPGVVVGLSLPLYPG